MFLSEIWCDQLNRQFLDRILKTNSASRAFVGRILNAPQMHDPVLRPIHGGHSDPFRQVAIVFADEVDDHSPSCENLHLQLPRFQNERNPILPPETCPKCGCQEEGCHVRVFSPGNGVTDYCECCADTPKTGWWHVNSTWWDEQRFTSTIVSGLHMVRNISGREESGRHGMAEPAHWWLHYHDKLIAKFPGTPAGFKQIVTLANNIVAGKLSAQETLELAAGSKYLFLGAYGGRTDGADYH